MRKLRLLTKNWRPPGRQIAVFSVFATLGVFLPTHALYAREVKFEKEIDPAELQSQLAAAGFKIDWIECSLNRCRIVMPNSEKKDPMPVVRKYVYTNPHELRRKKMAELRGLYDRWVAGTITESEKDRLIRDFIGMSLGW